MLSRSWLLLTIPVAFAALALLSWTIASLLRTVRSSVIATMPLVAEQRVEINSSGDFAINIESPLLTRRPINLRFTLSGVDSSDAHRHVSDSRANRRDVDVRARAWSSTPSRSSSAGAYHLRIDGLDPGTDYSRDAILITRQFRGALVLHVLALIACGVALIGSLVVSGLILSGKSFSPQSPPERRTGNTIAVTSIAEPRVTLLTRPMILLCSASFLAMVCFYLLLSVVPQYATSIGASGIGAGLATGALMLSTVATELATPRIVARFGYRATLASGLALLGAPALLLTVAHTMPTILAICLVRGAGLAIIVVVGGSLVASLVPPERRGEGLGLYGFIVNVPAVVGLPLGVWLAAHAGYPTVFIIAGLASLAGIAAVPGLPAVEAPEHEDPVGVLAGLLTPALARPAIVFSTTAMAAGVIVTFLPLAAIHASGNIIATALFVQAVASTGSRWYAGRLGDRLGHSALLIPGVLIAATGDVVARARLEHGGDHGGDGAVRHWIRHHAERDAHDDVRSCLAVGVRRGECGVERRLRRGARTRRRGVRRRVDAHRDIRSRSRCSRRSCSRCSRRRGWIVRRGAASSSAFRWLLRADPGDRSRSSPSARSS